MKDYYSILGVSRDATQEEIKKSYRSLCLSLHPDRQAGKSDEEKKKAEEKFKEVSEAYETLSDPDKKRAYDFGGSGSSSSYGFEEFFKSHGGFDPFTGQTDPFGFSDLFGERRRRNQGRNQNEEDPADLRGSDIKMNIPLTVEDLVNGCHKKLKYKRRVRCSSCHGKGGDGKIQCPYCNGSGRETETKFRSGMMFQTSTTCTHCHGKGYKIEKPCQHCNGSGFEYKEEILDVEFQPGIGDNPTIYSQKGNESKSERGSAGSFIAVPVIDTSTLGDGIEIKGYDIHQKIKVKITDALLGKEIEIQVPGMPKESYKLNEGTKPGDTIIKYGLGLLREDFEYGRKTRGNYIFDIEYKFPSAISDKQKLFIEKLAETGM